MGSPSPWPSPPPERFSWTGWHSQPGCARRQLAAGFGAPQALTVWVLPSGPESGGLVARQHGQVARATLVFTESFALWRPASGHWPNHDTVRFGWHSGAYCLKSCADSRSAVLRSTGRGTMECRGAKSSFLPNTPGGAIAAGPRDAAALLRLVLHR